MGIEKFGKGVEAKAVVLPWNEEAKDDNVPNFGEMTYPTEEEGFTAVEYKDTVEEEMQGRLDAWKKQCRVKARADDLKVGTFFKEQMAKFEKVKKLRHKNLAPKKKPVEEKKEEK